jgi:hypothetical protein
VIYRDFKTSNILLDAVLFVSAYVSYHAYMMCAALVTLLNSL